MYLNTNTLEGLKYKHLSMQKYLNKNTLKKYVILNLFLSL